MPYHSTARATHDLAHLDELSGEPSLILYVSERTSYLLSNLSAAEIANPSAYATEYAPEWYRPVMEEDEEWELFLAVVERAQDELVEVDMQRFYGVDYADLSGHQLLSQDAGDYYLEIDPVPEGQVWQVEALQLYTTRDYNNAIFRVVDGTGNIVIAREFSPGANYYFTWQGRFTISEGQYPQCRIKSIEDDADMTFYVWYVALV